MSDERAVPDEPMEASVDPSATTFDDLALSERFREYLVVFAIGLGIAVVVGTIIGILASPSIPASIAYMIMMVGVFFLLAGGLSGSGFNAGGFGGLFTATADEDERMRDRERDSAEAASQRAAGRGYDPGSGDESRRGRRRRDPSAAVQRRLNAGPNPRAFWGVVAGFVYVLLGVALVSLFP